MTAYYNEFDKYAAQWLRNLIDAGHIAPGIVDERSIEDVVPTDLAGFTQCHFFAGIGVWSLALRNAGWPDDRPVWTGSCPCQPFSAAGKGAGFADERHLWPSFFHLIEQCKPAAIYGEQVAASNVDPWIDLVHADLEAVGYAFGCVPFPSAGVGAPHIRDRAFWVADSKSKRCGKARQGSGRSSEWIGDGGESCRMDNTDNARLEGFGGGHQAAQRQRKGSVRPVAQAGELGGLADAKSVGWGEECADAGRVVVGNRPEGITTRLEHGGSGHWSGPVNGFWRDADWLGCRDGRWRPVEPGTFPLAHGASARVGRLRAFGNAINAQAATEFIRASGLIP